MFWFLWDDVQTIAAYMSQLDELQLRQIAAKLAPELPLVQYNLVFELMNRGQWKDVGAVMQVAMKVDSESWMAKFAQAGVLVHENKRQEAIQLLQQAIALHPYEASVHFTLAHVYGDLGKLWDARESFRAGLRCPTVGDDAERARKNIALLNEKIGGN